MHANHPLLDRPTEVEVVDASHQPWILVRCKETDFHFIANPPQYDRLAEEFAWEKTIETERQRRHREERLVAIASSVAKKLKFTLTPRRDKMFDLARRVLKGGNLSTINVLDVGCGNGKKMIGFCERFDEIGFRVVPFGIEISSFLAGRSRQRFQSHGGGVIENNAIDGLAELEPESVDLVTMLSFLEHESRPLDLLQSVKRVLKPGMFVIIKVPNFDSWGGQTNVVSLGEG